MKRKLIKGLVLLQIMAVGAALPAFAAEKTTDDYPWEKFTLNLGGYASAVDSSARIGTTGIGVVIDFEEALGLDSSTNVFRLDGRWRISKNLRHSMDFMYYEMNRDSARVLQTDIEWDGQIHTAGTTVRSSFNTEIFQLGYKYSYFLDDRTDLNVGIGLFVMPIEVSVKASGVGGVVENITTPLPYFSLGFEFSITPKLFLKQNLKMFYLEYDAFEGGVVNNTIAIEYNAWKNIGLGLALDSMRIKVSAEGDDYPGTNFAGSIEYSVTGIMLYMKAMF